MFTSINFHFFVSKSSCALLVGTNDYRDQYPRLMRWVSMINVGGYLRLIPLVPLLVPRGPAVSRESESLASTRWCSALARWICRYFVREREKTKPPTVVFFWKLSSFVQGFLRYRNINTTVIVIYWFPHQLVGPKP